jgi:hypothetical protein
MNNNASRPNGGSDDFRAWLTTLAVTLAFVLPMLALVIYGFDIGWLALGLGGLAVMFTLWFTYYSILWPLMQQRRG